VPSATGAKAAVEGGDASQISKSESSTFAVNKVVRHLVEPAGRIRRVTAALLVDDVIEVKQENGKRSETHRKRTSDELKQIEDLAKAAIGIDVNRGDSLTVQNLSFEQSRGEIPVRPSVTERVRLTLNDWSSMVRYSALILLFLLAYVLLLRPLKRQLLTTFRELPAHIASQKSQLATEAVIGLDGPNLSPEQQRSAALKKQLVEKVKSEPVATGKLIQAWIHEEGK
jgi:flagellar M-ring protein FliF